MNLKTAGVIAFLILFASVAFFMNGPENADKADQESVIPSTPVEVTSSSSFDDTTMVKITDQLIDVIDFEDLEIDQEIDKEKNDRLEPYHVVLRRYGKRDCSATQLVDVKGDGIYTEAPKCVSAKRIDTPHFLEEFDSDQLIAAIQTFPVEDAAIAAHLLAERRVKLSEVEKKHYGVDNYYELAVVFSGKPGSLIQFMNAGLLPNNADTNRLNYQYMVIAYLLNYPGYDSDRIAEKGESFIRRGLSPSDIATVTDIAEKRVAEWTRIREQLTGGSTSR